MRSNRDFRNGIYILSENHTMPMQCNGKIPVLSQKSYREALKIAYPMDKQTGRHINSFDSFQPITDVYCGQLTNERAPFLQYSIYEPSCLLVHGSSSPSDVIKIPFFEGIPFSHTLKWTLNCHIHVCVVQKLEISMHPLCQSRVKKMNFDQQGLDGYSYINYL